MDTFHRRRDGDRWCDESICDQGRTTDHGRIDHQLGIVPAHARVKGKYATQAAAPQAASVIHTDFEKGFIKAEVIGYDDFINYGSEAACREAGRLRIEGKEYIVKDGDVMHFRFNV